MCMKDSFCLVMVIQLLFIAHILFYRRKPLNIKALSLMLIVATATLGTRTVRVALFIQSVNRELQGRKIVSRCVAVSLMLMPVYDLSTTFKDS